MISLVQVKIKCRIELTDKVPKTKNNKLISQLQNKLIKISNIPYLWTDAVPWYAAAYALWSAQNNARMADAERYFNTYTMFVERARKASNPSINRWMYNQAGDPAQGAKMQVQPRGGAGG